jgi:hypothetical protein
VIAQGMQEAGRDHFRRRGHLRVAQRVKLHEIPPLLRIDDGEARPCVLAETTVQGPSVEGGVVPPAPRACSSRLSGCH